MPSLWEQIEHLLFATTTHDQLEEAARLDGHIDSAGRYVLRRAIRCATVREPDAAELDLLTSSGRLDGSLPLGDMHSHPSGGTEPSPADYDHWHRMARY